MGAPRLIRLYDFLKFNVGFHGNFYVLAKLISPVIFVENIQDCSSNCPEHITAYKIGGRQFNNISMGRLLALHFRLIHYTK
jgi:hypothetical protein